MAETPEEKDLFEDVEALEPTIVVGPSLDEKLDTIIGLLKKNQEEHQEIRERLDKIEKNQKTLSANQEMQAAASKDHGLKLGQLLTQCDERHAPRPLRLAAEMASLGEDPSEKQR
jgi:tetrahydromethanopterin S-methyltransferase subunit G